MFKSNYQYCLQYAIVTLLSKPSLFFVFQSSKQKPWQNGEDQVEAMHKMYDNEEHWYPTWQNEGDNLDMQVIP